jgi:hypothetical protein
MKQQSGSHVKCLSLCFVVIIYVNKIEVRHVEFCVEMGS